MKNIFFIFLLFLSSFVFGQKRQFTLSGKVTDCKTNDFIKGVTIKLVGSDGSSIETTTDYTGYYLFDSKRVNHNTQYVINTQVGTDVRNPKTNWGYLNSSDKIKISTYDSVKKLSISADFCLMQNKGCTYGPPPIYFKKNTIDFESGTSIDDTLNWITQIFLDNTHLVFEISGNASKDEKKPQELGQKRAELIRELLIKKGIEPERLTAKSYSDTNPHQYMNYDGQIIIENKNEESSYKMNRRVSMKIIRRDYVQKNPQKESPKTNNEDGE